jgi:hypothetical protein
MISPQVLGVFLEYGTSVAIPRCWETTCPEFWKLLINKKGGNLDFFFKCIGTAIGDEEDPTLQFSKHVKEWAQKTVDISMAMDIGGNELFSVVDGTDHSPNDYDLVNLFKLIFAENPIPNLLETLQKHLPKTTSESSSRRPPRAMAVPDALSPREQTFPSQSSRSSPMSTTGEHPPQHVRLDATRTSTSKTYVDEEAEDDAKDSDSQGDKVRSLPVWKDVEATFSEEAKLGQYRQLQLLKTRLPTLDNELYQFLVYLSEQYDLLVQERDDFSDKYDLLVKERDVLKRKLSVEKADRSRRKRRVHDDSESHSENTGKSKRVGKENTHLSPPLQVVPQKLFPSALKTQQRSSDSKGNTQETTPNSLIPRRRTKNTSAGTPTIKKGIQILPGSSSGVSTRLQHPMVTQLSSSGQEKSWSVGGN